jgi:transcriptional regulator with GAF, ATPase, and Fis domain
VFPPGEALARIDRLLLEDEARARRSDAMTLRLLGGRLRVQAERGEEARAGLEELVASLRKDGAVDDLASALSLLGAAHAACGREGPATRTFGRALRLARRLENVLVRAEVLETCGRSLRGRTGSEAAARSCLAEARDLFRAASLPGRAAAVEEHLQSPAPAGSWRGIPPERLAWVLEKTRRVNEAEDPAKVLVALLDAAIEATGAERGFLVLAAAAGGFEVQVARSMDAAEIGLPDRTLSASLVKTVLEEGKSVIAAEAREDPRFSEYFSVRNLQLRSVLAVPIARGARVLGAFYLDNRFLAGVFTEEHRAALEMLAGQAALAFENVKFREEVRALNLRLQERVEVQGKELDGLRTSMRDLRQETRYAYREIFRRRGPMVEALRLVDHAVENTLPVLLEGESGTGKELVARALHFEGPQRERPFVVVNCAAIPEALMESELFGHRKGAFTGAVEDREGLVEAADGGTLFLDEIGDLPLGLQPKLLRVLQFGEFTPLGGGETRRARVRVVAATNRDLRLRVAEGNFREDLYFRLAVFPVRLPPLRDRVEDLPVLAQALVRRFAEEAGHGPRRLSRKAVARLLAHDWPGNIRELENALRRAVLLVAGDVLEAEDLALESRARPETGLALDRIRAGVPGGLRPREELALRRILERGMLTLRDLVAMSGASKATAARDLQRLVEARVLARRGKTSAAWYEVAPRFAEAPEPNLRRDGPAAS